MSESTLNSRAITAGNRGTTKEKPKSTLFSAKKKSFKKKELVQMFRSLASMLRAQISTADAIKYYAHGHPSKDMVGSLLEICSDINKGVPVHSAFKRSERFDDMTIGLIQAGGDTGQLDTAFAELGKRIKNEMHFRRRSENSL
jgi:type II secretory pathway component PulF